MSIRHESRTRCLASISSPERASIRTAESFVVLASASVVSPRQLEGTSWPGGVHVRTKRRDPRCKSVVPIEATRPFGPHCCKHPRSHMAPLFCLSRRAMGITTRSVSEGEADSASPSLTLRVTICSSFCSLFQTKSGAAKLLPDRLLPALETQESAVLRRQIQPASCCRHAVEDG